MRPNVDQPQFQPPLSLQNRPEADSPHCVQNIIQLVSLMGNGAGAIRDRSLSGNHSRIALTACQAGEMIRVGSSTFTVSRMWREQLDRSTARHPSTSDDHQVADTNRLECSQCLP
jgi:hypothetical protein